MVKLDVSLLRFMEEEDFRVLTALEMTMRNHDVAPTALVERIAQLPHGGCRKRLKSLLKHKMIHHENTMYDGYAMKYGAYDYLALHTLCKRGTVAAVGHRIGCGKESDIILVKDEAGNECVLKLQRLGRCSFRSVTRNRDYKGGGRTRHGESWFYLSRLAAEKEFSFMKTLYDEGFPVPKPIDQNRHALLMELVDGTLLNNITALGDPEKVYRRALDLMIKLGEHGLVHGDFNEFNLMITEDMRVIVIDFPQMISINHPNASELFTRDVENLANFFQRRFKVTTLFYPTLEKDVERKAELDRLVFASGCFGTKQQQELERLMQNEVTARNDDEEDEEDNESEEDAVDTTTASGNRRVRFASAEDEVHQKEKEEERDNDSDDDDVSSSARSLDEAIDEAAIERRGQRQLQQNVNYNPDGTVNEDYVRSQVRRNIRRKDNHQFNLGLHRNVQKGRQKQKEITNTNFYGSENKENIPPALFGKSLNEGSKGCKINWKCTGITQLHNSSLNSSCCTPNINRQRVIHTGLTPGGNKSAAGLRCGGVLVSTNTNVADASFMTESDAGDIKDMNWFITPVERWDFADATSHIAAPPSVEQSQFCDLFEGSAPFPQPPYTADVSIESMMLPRGVLLESDEEDDDNDTVEKQILKKPCIQEPSRGITPLQPYSQPLQEENQRPQLVEKQEFVPLAPSLTANVRPSQQQNTARHSGPPPAYPHNENRTNVTRVVSSTAPLIAVGGRRVPIDKLHLLMRPPLPEEKNNGKLRDLTNVDNANVASAIGNKSSAPLVPSSRPTPTTVKAMKVMAPPGITPVLPMKRPLSVHQHCDYAILEFSRGVVMRFLVPASLPLPVVGCRYLAAIKSSRSPYDNVAYEDAGVCVYLQRHHSDNNAVPRSVQKLALYDGSILREISENNVADAERLRSLKTSCDNAIMECRKQFRFLNLPFELVDVCYTFDQSICIVYYTIQPQEGTSSQPNISRLLRMLQFKLQTKVFLKAVSSSE